jgi:hypothetical protein
MLQRHFYRFSGLRILAIVSFALMSIIGTVNPVAAYSSGGGAV